MKYDSYVGDKNDLYNAICYKNSLPYLRLPFNLIFGANITSCGFGFDDKYFAFSTDNGKIGYIDIINKQLLKMTDWGLGIVQVIINPRRPEILIITDRKIVQKQDFLTDKVSYFNTFTEQPKGVKYHKNGKYLCIFFSESAIIIDNDSNLIVNEILFTNKEITAIEFGYYRNSLAIGFKDGDIVIVDFLNSVEQKRWNTSVDINEIKFDEIKSLSYSKTFQFLVVGFGHAIIQIWEDPVDINAKSYIKSMNINTKCINIHSIKCDQTNDTFLFISAYEPTLKIYMMKNGKPVWVKSHIKDNIHSVAYTAFSEKGIYVAIARGDFFTTSLDIYFTLPPQNYFEVIEKLEEAEWQNVLNIFKEESYKRSGKRNYYGISDPQRLEDFD